MVGMGKVGTVRAHERGARQIVDGEAFRIVANSQIQLDPIDVQIVPVLIARRSASRSLFKAMSTVAPEPPAISAFAEARASSSAATRL